MKRLFCCLPLSVVLFCGGTQAATRVNLGLELTTSGFTPAHFTIAKNQRLRITMVNKTTKVAELESYDMKFEKIAIPGGRISVFTGPLKPGRYKFFNDYSDHVAGYITVTQ